MNSRKVSRVVDGEVETGEAIELVTNTPGRNAYFLVVREDNTFDEWPVDGTHNGKLSDKEAASLEGEETDDQGLPVEVPAVTETEETAPEPRDTSHDVVNDGTVDPNGPTSPKRTRRKTDGIDIDAVIDDNRRKGLANEETASGEKNDEDSEKTAA